MNFQLLKKATGCAARTTRFQTLHGEVETPIFMPVGTQATVKGLTVDILKSVGSNVLLANTYHLMLRPGVEVFNKFGGIHRFMNWDRPVLTDSGGFQIFSLSNERKITEDGAKFKSYIDGKTILLSPEQSIAVQTSIGSDIMMVLDQCVPSTSEHRVAEKAMHLTHRWAARSLRARTDERQKMFGIVQGACYEDLRRASADALCSMDFDGFAIGGLAVGETKSQREDFCELTASLLPEDKPRYLMGVGTPLDLLEAVYRGVDMFDCIIPSNLAKRGTAFTAKGKVHVYRGVYKLSEEPLDSACACETCRIYSRAYLHHLIKSDEYLGWLLISQHNLFFYHQFMREIREAINDDSFLAYYQQKRVAWAEGDAENPMDHPVKNPAKAKKTSTARPSKRAPSP